jgi:membrane-bound metal-dependent hydrolase YbcI (DUF457 family)
MTLTGHLLTGTAIGIVVMSEYKSDGVKAVHLISFALLALLPDWPIKGWAHQRYYFSHSLFVNLLMIAAGFMVFLFLPKARNRIGGWPVLVGAVLAWLSHLLLDSFYNHGHGVAIFWPFSDARLKLPIPWLAVVNSPVFPITPEKVRGVLIETVSFLPLVILAIVIRKKGWIHKPGKTISTSSA